MTKRLNVVNLFSLLALLVICLPACVHAEEVTIAAYNAQNFFDVFDDPYMEDETTEVKPRDKIEMMASAVKSINPDIIAFSEIENEHVLKSLAWDFMPGRGYDYISADKTNSGRGIQLGIISRKPILSETSYRFRELKIPGADRTWKFARDLWHVKLQLNESNTLDLFVVHFKSRRDSADDPESTNWRLAEAMEARRIIEAFAKQNRSDWYAIVGDFNDTPDGKAINHLLDGRPPLLVDVHAQLPKDERITYLHEPYRSTIDYILVSPLMARRMKPGSAKVMQSYSLLGGSDHAPIWATFVLPR